MLSVRFLIEVIGMISYNEVVHLPGLVLLLLLGFLAV